MARFVVELVYGADRERLQEVRPAHREYLKRLAERGTLLAAGPYADDDGAMAVFEVADEAELRQILHDDPYTAAGVVAKREFREWNALVGHWLS